MRGSSIYGAVNRNYRL